MAVHIGSKIKQITAKKGVNITEFSRRINTSRENVYGIFKRKTIDTGLLEKISKILEHDFFQYYSPVHEENARLKEDNALLREMLAHLKSKSKKK
jgi:DNA-binding Xre family transcriptional regulator